MPEPLDSHDASPATPGAAAHQAASHGHHHFDFNALNESHNKGYPAVEWVHGHAPQLILNLPAYAAKNYAVLVHDPAAAEAESGDLGLQAWARDWLASRPAAEGAAFGGEAGKLATAMALAQDQAWMTLPRGLAFFNHQTFWSTIALLLAALVLLVTHRRKPDQYKPANRVQHMLEAVVLYIRDEVVRPNIHHHPERWTPFLASLFLAILTMNLFGMVPFFGTATSDIMMTASWSVFILVLMLYQGIKHHGAGGFWFKLVPVHWSWNPMDMFVYVLLMLLEWLSLLIRPAVLAIRLFANMLAGHTVLLVFISLGFIVHATQPDNLGMAAGLGLLGWVVAIAFYFLELLVSFVQAYVFVVLSAVFIGACIQPEH